MLIYRLPEREIDRFASTGVDMAFLPSVDAATHTRVNIARIAAGGTLGEHPATALQVFAVVSGEAVVSSGAGDAAERRTLRAGHAVVWQPGEVHQTWATTDVVATIVEACGDDVTLGLDLHFEDVTDAT
jgi:quercetin dioxygenase-like cupin family protein